MRSRTPADHGIDVVNMSFYIDPWLRQLLVERSRLADAADRAADDDRGHGPRARLRVQHGVTLIASEGNEHTDLGNPTSDAIEPRLPRRHDPPADGRQLVVDRADRGHHVISVGADRTVDEKADYSNWGTEQTQVTAPAATSATASARRPTGPTEPDPVTYPKSLAQARAS